MALQKLTVLNQSHGPSEVNSFKSVIWPFRSKPF